VSERQVYFIVGGAVLVFLLVLLAFGLLDYVWWIGCLLLAFVGKLFGLDWCY
jgi:hypothetical protein